MQNNLIESVLQKSQKSRWLPVLSMLISLFGIVALHWDFQYLIILFIWEVFLMLTFALIRMFFAMNNLPFYKTLIEKLFYIPAAILMGILLLIFSFMFMNESINMDTFIPEIRKIKNEIYMLTFGYIVGLFFNFLGNKKYKSAVPMMQLGPFIHVLVILGILQGFTGHLLPRFSNLDQAVWGIVALVLVKFCVDLLFNFFQNQYSNSIKSNLDNYAKF